MSQVPGFGHVTSYFYCTLFHSPLVEERVHRNKVTFHNRHHVFKLLCGFSLRHMTREVYSNP